MSSAPDPNGSGSPSAIPAPAVAREARAGSARPHFTTRRGFIAAAGFGGVGLYGLWAGYGAAPGPLAWLDSALPAAAPPAGHAAHEAPAAPTAAAGGHGGHGAAPAVDAEAFRRSVAEFSQRWALPDGTVYPRLADPHRGHDAAAEAPDSVAPGGHGDHGDQGGPGAAAASTGHAEHGAPAAPADHGNHDAPAAPAGHADHNAPAAPIDVPMIAGQWYYQPARLRLDRDRRYRLRMLALDVSHGASIQFGRGARMIRLRPGRITELELRFTRPGRYLVYCTVYCGAAHDVMQATIEVV